MLTFAPFTLTWPCAVIWRAAARVGANPSRYTTLSNLRSSSERRTFPVDAGVFVAFSYNLRNCFSKTPYMNFTFCFSVSCSPYSVPLRRCFFPCSPGRMLMRRFVFNAFVLRPRSAPILRANLFFGPVRLAMSQLSWFCAIVRDWCNVRDHGYLNTCRAHRTERSITARSWAFDKYVHVAHAKLFC